MDFGMKNKVAIVAASSRGLGKATAMALAQAGAAVVICSRNWEELQTTGRELTTSSRSAVLPIQADLTMAGDIRNVVHAAKEKFGAIHILVNNAGGPPAGDILSMTDDDWRRSFELTVMSTVRLTREVLPMMASQRWGRVITIVSIAAVQPLNDLLISSTLRPGIFGFSKILSNQYAHLNITVNTVCPGLILTSRQKELMDARSAEQKISEEQYFTQAAKDIPAGRLGKPEEVGNVIAFLASEQASYITGANIMIDGGMAKGI